MRKASVDTDVVIRLLTGDDPDKQAAARKLFESVERSEIELACPDTVIADAVYVLHSRALYSKSRPEVRELLLGLLRLPHFHVADKAVVAAALDIFAQSSVDFGDAMIIADLHRRGETLLYSYDRDFDSFDDVKRQDPSAE